MNLRLEAGQVLALVGPSGAGKSTLFSCCCGSTRRSRGEIRTRWHRHQLEVKARELRKQVALVPQRTTVFSGTIADAIRFGRDASGSSR